MSLEILNLLRHSPNFLREFTYLDAITIFSYLCIDSEQSWQMKRSFEEKLILNLLVLPGYTEILLILARFFKTDIDSCSKSLLVSPYEIFSIYTFYFGVL